MKNSQKSEFCAVFYEVDDQNDQKDSKLENSMKYSWGLIAFLNFIITNTCLPQFKNPANYS